MKKINLLLCFLIISYGSFADSEISGAQLYGGFQSFTTDPSVLKPINPCGTYLFLVQYFLPTNYISVSKFQWYVNNVLVKTTTDGTDPLLNWSIKASTTTMYCVVTYVQTNGNLSTSLYMQRH